MTLIGVVVTLIVVGILMWLEETYIPMAPPIKKIIRVVVIISVVLWLLNVFGVFSYLGNVGMPRLHH
jgi:hypothetical protein